MSYSITIMNRPFSFNSFSEDKKAQYRKEFLSELLKKYKNVKQFDVDIYGFIYFFRAKKDKTDADNISKPVWDSLCTILYHDDLLVKHRRSTIIDYDDFSKLDFSKITSRDYKKIVHAMDINKDLLYIEVGKYNESLIEFSREK